MNTSDSASVESGAAADDDRRSGIIRRMRVLNNLIVRPYYLRTQKPYGVSLSEWRTIRALRAKPGTTQSEIAEDTAMHAMTLSRSVTSLRRKGLIVTEVDPDDRRRIRLHLTETGEQIGEELALREKLHDEFVVSGISKEEAAQLDHIVTKLIEHMRKVEEPMPPPPSRDWRSLL